MTVATAKYAPVRAEYINPFLGSAAEVFRTMLGCQLTRGTPYMKHMDKPEHEISGIIGLSGRAVGTVVLSLSENVAIEATAAMLGDRPFEMNSDVVDAIGELTNMIAGSAKGQLEELEMSISLPNVIIGKNHEVVFPSGVTPIGIPFTCDWGDISVNVGLGQKTGD